jgi:hypothetical protein
MNTASEAAFLAFYGGLTLLTGLVVRWPALLLPFLICAALVPLGVNPEDSDRWTYAGLYAIPSGFLSFPVLLLGSVAGTLADIWSRRSEART